MRRQQSLMKMRERHHDKESDDEDDSDDHEDGSKSNAPQGQSQENLDFESEEDDVFQIT